MKEGDSKHLHFIAYPQMAGCQGFGNTMRSERRAGLISALLGMQEVTAKAIVSHFVPNTEGMSMCSCNHCCSCSCVTSCPPIDTSITLMEVFTFGLTKG